MQILVNVEPRRFARDIMAGTTNEGIMDLIQWIDFEEGDDDFTFEVIKRLLTNVRVESALPADKEPKPAELIEKLTKLVNEIEQEYYGESP